MINVDEILSGVIVVTDEEYDYAVECLTSPQQPTKAIMDGAQLLNSLRPVETKNVG